MKRVRVGLLAISLGLIAGCTGATSADKTFRGSGPIKVVATTAMIGDLVRSIGGANVEVTDLFKPGVDPHTYSPTTNDLLILQSANLIVHNGLHLEGKLATVLDKLGSRIPSLGAADSLLTRPASHIDGGPSWRSKDAYQNGWVLKSEDHPDPHVWFDVYLWSLVGEAVRDQLRRIDPSRAGDYDANYRKLAERFHALDRETHDALAGIPRDRRVLVTSHDAFRYLGRAYDVDVRGIQGINTDVEASVGHVADLVDFLSKSKVKAVFVESSVNPRTMQAVIDGVKARGHSIRLGGELFSDAMGDPGTPEGTYEGMVRHNVRTIVQALK